jgi:hypothetical protein
MPIAQIRVTALANDLYGTGRGSGAGWHNLRDRIAEAVGPSRLVRVSERYGEVVIESRDRRWSVRDPAPGTYRIVSKREARKALKRGCTC